MKKTIYLLSAVLLALTACKKNDPTQDDTQQQNEQEESVTTVLSPEEQESKLKGIGNDVIGQFNNTDFKSLWLLVDNCYGKFEAYDKDESWEEFEDNFLELENFIGDLSHKLQVIPEGDITVLSDAYVFAMDKVHGTYTADDNRKVWTRTNGDANTLKVLFNDMDGDACEIKAVASGKTFNIVSYWDSYNSNYNPQTGLYTSWEERQPVEYVVPEVITITVTEAGYQHMKMVLKFDMVNNSYFNYNMDCQIASMNFTSSTNITSTSAKTNITISQNSRQLFAGEVNVPSCVLKQKSSTQNYDDYFDSYEEDYEDGKTFGVDKADATIDILKSAQVKCTVTNPVGFAQKMEDIDDKYSSAHSNSWQNDHMSYTEYKDYNKALAACWKSYVDCGLYYNSDILQASLDWDVTSYTQSRHISTDVQQVYVGTYPYGYYDYQYNYKYADVTIYDCSPVIYFPSSDTSFAFGDYFSSNMYNSMLKKIEDLCNEYIMIAKYMDIEPVDFDVD